MQLLGIQIAQRDGRTDDDDVATLAQVGAKPLGFFVEGGANRKPGGGQRIADDKSPTDEKQRCGQRHSARMESTGRVSMRAQHR